MQTSNAIKQARRQAAIGELKATPSLIRSLQRFMRNRDSVNTLDDIEDALRSILSQATIPLEEKFNADSLVWIRKLMLRKDGEFRDTVTTRRLKTERERNVVRNGTHFTLHSMHYEYGMFRPERLEDVHAVWRLHAGEDFITFLNIPWQNNMDHSLTGFFLEDNT